MNADMSPESHADGLSGTTTLGGAENRSKPSYASGNRPSRSIECGTCGAWWTRELTAHCSGCHRTYTGMTAFDAHRSGSHTAGTRHCLDPADVGLVDAGRAYPCWGTKGDGTEWWKASA